MTTRAMDRGSRWRSRVMLGALMGASLSATNISVEAQGPLDYRVYRWESASMEPTIRRGETLLVDTGYYRSRRPDRGDVVVFTPPKRSELRFVIRVIGLPGDRIQVVGGTVHINEQPTGRERVGNSVETTTDGDRFKRWRETLSTGVSYMTFEYDSNPQMLYDSSRNTAVYTVPPESYFVMGDNRDNSADSRDPTGLVGYVPFSKIIGSATRIVSSPDASRVGLLIQPQRAPAK
jgi:signal peptidase I